MPITSEMNFYNIHQFLDLTNLKLEKRYLKFLNIFLGKEPVTNPPPPKKKTPGIKFLLLIHNNYAPLCFMYT